MADTNTPESKYRARALEYLIGITENSDYTANTRIKAAKVILRHTGTPGTSDDEPEGQATE